MIINTSKITTEGQNKKTINIDTVTTLEALILINNEDKQVPTAIKKALPQIAKTVDKAYEVIKNGGRVIYIGAGTSGRIGVLDASEVVPTFGTDDNTIIGIIAGGDKALREAIEGVEDSKEAALQDLINYRLTNKDLVIAIAASGRTPYAIGAVEYAKSINAKTACITTSGDSVLAAIVDFPIEAITGPEALTGSTRMKSGTAQKLICNMISTVTMIKLGKAYRNLMVDVKMSNAKLIARATNIVIEITGASKEDAYNAVVKYNSAKKAIFSIVTGINDLKIIDEELTKANGKLRDALQNNIK